MDILAYLLNREADINWTDGRNYSPLTFAASQGHADAVRYLLREGAVADGRTRTGRSALMTAADRGTVAVLEILLEFGADINLMDENGHTALHFASRSGRTDAVKFLLSRGAIYEQVALTLAVQESRASCAIALLDKMDKNGQVLSQEIQNRRLSLLVLGSHRAGKSSLIQRLAGQTDHTTGEIIIDNFTFLPFECSSRPESADMQSVLVPPANVVFIVVCRPSLGQVAPDLIAHLNKIKDFAPQSRVLIVSTFSEDRRLCRDMQTSLLKSFNNIASFHQIDNRSGKGIKFLKYSLLKIAEEAVLSVRPTVPLSYLTLQSFLEEISENSEVFPIISKGLFDLLARENGLSDTRTAQEVLQSWGRVGQLVSGDITLKPRDTVRLISIALSTASRNSGKLLVTDCEDMWKAYTRRMRTVQRGELFSTCPFLDLLHHCHLAVRIMDEFGRSKEFSVLPSVLPCPSVPVNSTSIVTWLPGSDKEEAGRSEMRMEFRRGLQSAVMGKLTARLQRFVGRWERRAGPGACLLGLRSRAGAFREQWAGLYLDPDTGPHQTDQRTIKVT